MAGASRGGGGHLRAGPSHLPPRSRVQAAAKFRPRLLGPQQHSYRPVPPPTPETLKKLTLSPGKIFAWEVLENGAHKMHTHYTPSSCPQSGKLFVPVSGGFE